MNCDSIEPNDCYNVNFNNIIDGARYEEFSSEKIDDFRIKLRYNISK